VRYIPKIRILSSQNLIRVSVDTNRLTDTVLPDRRFMMSQQCDALLSNSCAPGIVTARCCTVLPSLPHGQHTLIKQNTHFLHVINCYGCELNTNISTPQWIGWVTIEDVSGAILKIWFLTQAVLSFYCELNKMRRVSRPSLPRIKFGVSVCWLFLFFFFFFFFFFL
jgi:hypothetical protein